MADPTQIHQVVMNLVINAREALHGAGGNIRLQLTRVRDGANKAAARITVNDDGPGIGDAIRSQIFLPFFTTKPHGTGLGLATVHEIVASMEGTVEVESAPGHGATSSRSRSPV